MNKNIDINHKTILVCTFLPNTRWHSLLERFIHITYQMLVYYDQRGGSRFVAFIQPPRQCCCCCSRGGMQSLTLQSSYREALFFQEHAQINALKHET